VNKIKILYEDLISRTQQNYGNIDKSYIFIDIPIQNNIENKGLFSDYDFTNEIPNYTLLQQKLQSLNIQSNILQNTIIINSDDKDIRLINKTLSDFLEPYNIKYTIKFLTDDKSFVVKTYNKLNRFIVGLNVNTIPYISYDNIQVDGVNKVLNLTPLKYVVETNNDAFVGTLLQQYGFIYEHKENLIDEEIEFLNDLGFDLEEQVVEGTFRTQSFNTTNSDIKALVKEELYDRIIEEQEIYSDVFIDRGFYSPFETHLKILEINTIEDID
jgi:hypothetical protein